MCAILHLVSNLLPIHELIDRVLRIKANQSIPLARLEFLLLVRQFRRLSHLLHLSEVEIFELLWKLIIHTLCPLRSDIVYLTEELLHDDGVPHILNAKDGIGNGVLASLVVHDARPELSSLRVLRLLTFVREMALAADNGIADLIRRFCNIRAELVDEAVGHVLRVPTVIPVTAELPIETKRRHRLGHEGAVDGDLVHIGANAMVLRITVEKHAELQERIRAVFDAWDHTAGGEGRLLNIAVVILWVLVQGKLPKVVHGELIARPDFRDVEGVKAQLFEIGFLGLHDLKFGGPGRILTVFDGVPKIAFGVVGVGTAELGRFGSGKLFLAVIGYEVVFDVDLHGQSWYWN